MEQQIHGGAMAKNMGGNTFGFQRGTFIPRRLHVFPKHILDAVSAQGLAPGIWEERVDGLAVTFPRPTAEGCDGFLA